MPADRNKVGVKACRSFGKLSEALNHIAVKQGVFGHPFGQSRRLPYRLNSSCFVVDKHDRHHYDRIVKAVFKVAKTDFSVPSRRQNNSLKASLFQLPYGIKHRRMLDCGGYYLLSQPLFGVDPSEQGEIVGLGAAGGEKNLPFVTAQFFGHGLSGGTHLPFGVHPHGIDRRRISENRSHHVKRLLSRLFAHPCGGAVVKIYLCHLQPSSLIIIISYYTTHILNKQE